MVLSPGPKASATVCAGKPAPAVERGGHVNFLKSACKAAVQTPDMDKWEWKASLEIKKANVLRGSSERVGVRLMIIIIMP